MIQTSKSRATAGATAHFICLVVVLISYSLMTSADSQTVNTANHLLTGLDIGKLSSKLAITGTLLNPDNFESQFEAVSALLSLFDLQEKVNNEIALITLEGSGRGMVPDVTGEDKMTLTNMQILLENVIQDSCDYINWTLSDFFNPKYTCNALTQQSFNCSREAAQVLQLKLNLWMANRSAYNSIKDFLHSCNDESGCNFPVETVGRPDWVDRLNLNVSDTEEIKVKTYLECII